MKKLVAVIIIVTMILTLCSCRTSSDDISNNSSDLETIYNSQIEEVSSEENSSIEEDVSSQIEETNVSSKVETSNNNTSNVESENVQSTVTNNSSEDKNVSSNVPNEENVTKQENDPVFLTVDTSRAPSTDIGSIISDGYVYYTNPTTAFPDGLFRKKITGGSEEKVTDLSVTEYSVLNGNVYYIHQFNLYKCNVDGTGVKKLYDNISNIVVAGDWIFAIRNLGTNSFSNKPTQELYIISTDGSVVKRIQPDCANDAGSTVTIYGFNRGYCYLEVTHYFYISGQPSTISFSSNSLCVRIDYRSKDLTQRKLKNNTEYTYDGMTHYSFNLKSTVIINDHVIQDIGTKKYAVSLLTNKGVTIYDRNTDGNAEKCSVKDYLVFMPTLSSMKAYKVTFASFNGDVKTYTFDWSKYSASNCHMYSEQDRRNSNSIFLFIWCSATDEYILQMIDSNGQATEIYRKVEE